MWWVSRQARMHACIFPMHHPRQDDDDLSWRTVEDACVSSSPPHHSISCISCISWPFWNISKRCWCWDAKSCCAIGLSSSSSMAWFLSKAVSVILHQVHWPSCNSKYKNVYFPVQFPYNISQQSTQQTQFLNSARAGLFSGPGAAFQISKLRLKIPIERSAKRCCPNKRQTRWTQIMFCLNTVVNL